MGLTVFSSSPPNSISPKWGAKFRVKMPSTNIYVVLLPFFSAFFFLFLFSISLFFFFFSSFVFLSVIGFFFLNCFRIQFWILEFLVLF